MGKVEVRPETLTCSSSSLGLDSWPSNNPQTQTRCSRAVFEGSTQGNPVPYKIRMFARLIHACLLLLLKNFKGF
jgi:hypothetical protein